MEGGAASGEASTSKGTSGSMPTAAAAAANGRSSAKRAKVDSGSGDEQLHDAASAAPAAKLPKPQQERSSNGNGAAATAQQGNGSEDGRVDSEQKEEEEDDDEVGLYDFQAQQQQEAVPPSGDLYLDTVGGSAARTTASSRLTLHAIRHLCRSTAPCSTLTLSVCAPSRSRTSTSMLASSAGNTTRAEASHHTRMHTRSTRITTYSSTFKRSRCARAPRASLSANVGGSRHTCDHACLR